MTRRILCKQSRLRLGLIALAVMIFAGCATPRPASVRSAQRESSISAERLRKIRSRQAKLEDLHERQLVLGNVRKSQTVRIQKPSVHSVQPNQVSQWAIAPGAEREQLKHPARESSDALLPEESPSPVVGVEDLAAFDHLKANQKLQRELPSKVAAQEKIEVPVVPGGVLDLTRPAAKSKTAAKAKTAPADTSKTGWLGSRADIANTKDVQSESAIDAKPVESEQAEHILYAAVMRAYKRRDQVALDQSVNLFMKTYPASIYADNALYLEALLLMEKQSFAKADGVLSEILRQYPKGNKVVAALFTRAAIYRETKQWKKARSLLEEIKNNYPGSAESQRVPLEVRMIASLEKKGPQR